MAEDSTIGQVVEALPTEALTGRERQIAALRAHGTATQFKPGNPGNLDGGRTNSMRAQIRHLMATGRLEYDKKASKWKLDLPAAAKVATIYAASVLVDGLNAKTPSVRLKFAQWLTDQIDGKLIQANLNADIAAMQALNDEEIDAYIAQLQSIVHQTANGTGVDGEGAAIGTDTNYGQEPQGDPKA